MKPPWKFILAMPALLVMFIGSMVSSVERLDLFSILVWSTASAFGTGYAIYAMMMHQLTCWEKERPAEPSPTPEAP